VRRRFHLVAAVVLSLRLGEDYLGILMCSNLNICCMSHSGNSPWVWIYLKSTFELGLVYLLLSTVLEALNEPARVLKSMAADLARFPVRLLPIWQVAGLLSS
jgi:hypothetical protein